MPRLTLAAVPLLAGLLPLSAGALGLGEISLRSALNQPFDADIPVEGDTPDELRQLQVRLAPPDVFQRFGLDRPSFLNDLSFQVQVQAQGNRGVVRVTSARAVSEPFVSLLVEVTWPAGRLLREYTVLLDPPAFAQPAPPPQVSAPSPVAQPTTGTGSVVSRPPAPTAAPKPDAAATGGSGTPTPAPGMAAGPATSAGTYGPVRPNETLWVIAQSVRPDDAITTNEMMLALFRANPEAFAGNINRLRAGAILRVPGAGEIPALAGPDPIAEVRRQNEEWRGATVRAAGDGSQRLQLVPPAEEGAGASPPAGGAVPARAGDGTRAADLAAELAESRRLLELRNQELKALQDRVASLEGRRPDAPPATVADGGAPGPDETALEETAIERLPDETDLLPTEDPAALATGSEAPVEATPRARRPVARPGAASEPETSFLGSLGNLVLNAWFLGAAAVVLLGSLFLFRRRSTPVEDFQFPVRDLPVGGPAPGGQAPTPVPVRQDSFIVEETGDAGDRTSIAPAPRLPIPRGDGEQPLEKTISADSGMEIDQADVVAEADFHMAYGLYDQAADLLGKALRNDPSRRDLRLKLLEVYFIWENKGAFLKEARAFHEQLKGGADPEWNKVLLMGKQLCPEDSLFAGQAAPPPSDSLDFSLDETGRSTGVDISFDDAAATRTAVDLDIPARDAGDSLDFDLGDSDTGATQSTTGLNTDLTAGLSPTMEAPTIESSALTESPTVETPTLETTGLGWESPGDAGRRSGRTTAETPVAESTQEINLEDLGLDLTGLDEAAGDLAGTTNLGPGPDFDVGENLGDGSPSSLLQEPTGSGFGPDATAEVQGLDEGTLDLPAFGTALEKSGGQAGSADTARDAGDTAEHKALDDTAEQPRRPWQGSADEDAGDLGLDDLDLGMPPASGTTEEVETTAASSGRRGPEGPTMTEVGTKLDLARAYIDMGDPDGARSILNEVLEEGDGPQRQEARKLLDELAD